MATSTQGLVALIEHVSMVLGLDLEEGRAAFEDTVDRYEKLPSDIFTVSDFAKVLERLIAKAREDPYHMEQEA